MPRLRLSPSSIIGAIGRNHRSFPDTMRSSLAMMAMVFARRRPGPGRERCAVRLEDFDFQRIACRNIARMCRTAISARAGRQRAKQINFREKLDVVTWSHRTCLHEIFMRVPGKPGAHEDIEHVADVMLDRTRLDLQFGGKRAG